MSGLHASDWNQALRALAVALPEERPAVVVIDEVPWLVEQDQEFEGALQTVWDRFLSAKPVLLLLVGSDLSVMEALASHGRPFFGRAALMTVRPLNLADVAEMTGLDAADAVDAQLITGGFPEIVRSWRPGTARGEFLRQSLENPLSPLLRAGELSLLGEFPGATLSRSVLAAVGTHLQRRCRASGRRGRAGIGHALAAAELSAGQASSGGRPAARRRPTPGIGATAWTTLICGSGSRSSPAPSPWSSGGAQTWLWRGSSGRGRPGEAGLLNR